MKKAILPILFLILVLSCKSDKVRMTSTSMEPTIKRGELIKIDFKAYKHNLPERWDIVAYETEDGELWIHRVVGMPGETIRIDVDEIYINEKKLEKSEKLSGVVYMPSVFMMNPNAQPPYKSYRVPESSYFLLGDNKGQAKDSRIVGAISIDKIKGKVLLQ